MLNLYHVSQDLNSDYDTYSDFVVACETEKEARETHPSRFVTHSTDTQWFGTHSGDGTAYETENDSFGSWVKRTDVDKITVKLIGMAHPDVKPGVVCSSFHAG